MNINELQRLLPKGAELHIHDQQVLDKNYQDSVWYMGDLIATIFYNGQEIKIASCGELRIYHKDVMVRHTSGLQDIGVTNDAELYALPDEAWHNNTWFEAYSDLSPEGVVLDSAYEAIKTTIKDLSWWEDIRKSAVA